MKHIITSLLLHCIFSSLNLASLAEPTVPAIYVFGDSTVDVGNNDYLSGTSIAKADFSPYGVDFPHSRPTGRFSNGYNSADFLAKYAGFKRSPLPYLSISPKMSNQISKGLRGINFASGGSGILDSTGTEITMSQQIEYFKSTKLAMTQRLGIETANDILSRSLFVVSTGGNDLFAFVQQNSSPNNTQVAAFVTDLLAKYQSHFKTLYDLGARKFGIADVAPIGCCPVARAQNPNGDCVKGMNDLAKGFNDALRSFLIQLSPKLQGMKYSVGSSYEVITDIIFNPVAAGFNEVQSACCGSGRFNGQECLSNSTYCGKRNKYLFWDRIHGTQEASKRVTYQFYFGSLQFASPINLKQLVEAH